MGRWNWIVRKLGGVPRGKVYCLLAIRHVDATVDMLAAEIEMIDDPRDAPYSLNMVKRRLGYMIAEDIVKFANVSVYKDDRGKIVCRMELRVVRLDK